MGTVVEISSWVGTLDGNRVSRRGVENVRTEESIACGSEELDVAHIASSRERELGW